MATLIPALSTCTSRMTSGERRLAERLERKLEDDYMLWYDVPVGPKQTHPDFVVIHPRRGAVLILEVKDWKPGHHPACHASVFGRSLPDSVAQGRDQSRWRRRGTAPSRSSMRWSATRKLVQGPGPHQGKLAFPWGHGVVLTNITRKQFDRRGPGARPLSRTS
jgi:hypothetical protein